MCNTLGTTQGYEVFNHLILYIGKVICDDYSFISLSSRGDWIVQGMDLSDLGLSPTDFRKLLTLLSGPSGCSKHVCTLAIGD